MLLVVATPSRFRRPSATTETYINSAADANAFDEFNSLYTIMSSNSGVDLPTIEVDLFQKCNTQLQLGKAAGADGLVAEHIAHAAPSLIIHLKLLFS